MSEDTPLDSVLPGDWSKLHSVAILPSLLSLETMLSPVNLLVNGDAESLAFLKEDGENFSRLSDERDLGVGVIKPKKKINFQNHYSGLVS